MMNILRRIWLWLLAWFKSNKKAINAKNTLLALDIIPPPLPRQQEPAPPLVPKFIHRRGKFVKPVGPVPVKTKREPSDKPRKPKALPKARVSATEDPEQWGQYYFRDAILDQLDMYFTYLKRMKRADSDAYNLHRQLGIQIMPRSAIQTFDNWRSEGQIDELSAWWKQHKPAFGAISYGIDSASLHDEKKFVDAPPEFFEEQDKYRPSRGKHVQKAFHRIATATGGGGAVDVGGGKKEDSGLIWFPKFLYFQKCKRIPGNIEHVSGSDVYIMTIYWDRVSGGSRTWHKRHKGGSPQEYALCINRETNQIRILRQQIVDSVKIKSRNSSKGYINIPQKYWTSCADRHLNWAFGRNDASPEGYLIRCFVEAALMYESAALGSMIRVECQKNNLTAAFGVDVKRMSYFFKDRDRVLTPKGKSARIFHIVRPHVRVTKKGEIGVKLTYRGLRQFSWAGYQIRISVPGRDHFHLAEFDIASNIYGKKEKFPQGTVGTKHLGHVLTDYIKEGLGAWQANAK